MVTPVTQPAEYEVTWNNAGGRVWVRQDEVRVDGCQKKLERLQGQDRGVGARLQSGSVFEAGIERLVCLRIGSTGSTAVVLRIGLCR